MSESRWLQEDPQRSNIQMGVWVAWLLLPGPGMPRMAGAVVTVTQLMSASAVRGAATWALAWSLAAPQPCVADTHLSPPACAAKATAGRVIPP